MKNMQNTFVVGDLVRIISTPGIEPICEVLEIYTQPQNNWTGPAHQRLKLKMVAPLRGYGRLEDFSACELVHASLEEVRGYIDDRIDFELDWTKAMEDELELAISEHPITSRVRELVEAALAKLHRVDAERYRHLTEKAAIEMELRRLEKAIKAQ